MPGVRGGCGDQCRASVTWCPSLEAAQLCQPGRPCPCAARCRQNGGTGDDQHQQWAAELHAAGIGRGSSDVGGRSGAWCCTLRQGYPCPEWPVDPFPKKLWVAGIRPQQWWCQASSPFKLRSGWSSTVSRMAKRREQSLEARRMWHQASKARHASTHEDHSCISPQWPASCRHTKRGSSG